MRSTALEAWLLSLAVVTAGTTVSKLASAAPPDQPGDRPAVQRPGATPPDDTPEPGEPDPESEPEPEPDEALSPNPDDAPEPAATPEPEPGDSPPPSDDTPVFGLPEPSPPSDDGGLPSYAEAPVQAPLDDADIPAPPATVETPPSGRGRFAVGSIMLVGGATLAGVSAGLLAQNIDLAAWVPGAIIGAGSVIAGSLLMTDGAVKRGGYREWLAHNGGEQASPATGDGLFASGILCMSAGTFGALMGGISLTLQDADDPPYGEVLLPVGIVSAAAGVALVSVGTKRRRAYRAWQGQLVPSLAVRTRGLSVGLAGRF